MRAGPISVYVETPTERETHVVNSQLAVRFCKEFPCDRQNRFQRARSTVVIVWVSVRRHVADKQRRRQRFQGEEAWYSHRYRRLCSLGPRSLPDDRHLPTDIGRGKNGGTNSVALCISRGDALIGRTDLAIL